MTLDISQLQQIYPALCAIPHRQLQGDFGRLQRIEVPARTPLFREGAPCLGFPLVLSGSVRVTRTSSGGRSLELYRVGQGEICLISASCAFGNQPLTANGDAVVATKILMVDRETLLTWTNFREMRAFVLGTMAERMADLMTLVEAIAFQPLDARLASALLGRGSTVHETHQQLADELGTAREIVSRLLGRFEAAGWVVLGRERIEIQDAAALRRLSLNEAD